MKKENGKILACCITIIACLAGSGIIYSNGGPFVVKYPDGDTAAKGILARLDPDLKPSRETQLKVTEENLSIVFGEASFPMGPNSPPLVGVTAEYKIENPTDKEIQVDFGFPILRGIYMSPLRMVPEPDVEIMLNKMPLGSTIISNSAIYGLIRKNSRAIIDKAITEDAELIRLTGRIRNPANEHKDQTRQEIISYLTGKKNWNERNAALLIEYACLNFEKTQIYPPDRTFLWTRDTELNKLISQNIGPLGAIGEQKATQFFAQLASCFDKNAFIAYEEIFKAWGGDVRDMAVDFKTGQMRPRELTIKKTDATTVQYSRDDPTIYARIDYFDENSKISEAEKASCKAILKNLPVVFTFAPMNILYYQAKFPAKSTQTLSVSYNQYAFVDTKEPQSYQLAYVLHPASLWDEFGPINIKVSIPAGTQVCSSIPLAKGANQQGVIAGIIAIGKPSSGIKTQGKEFEVYTIKTNEKKGELFIAIDADSWKKAVAPVRVAASGQISASLKK